MARSGSIQQFGVPPQVAGGSDAQKVLIWVTEELTRLAERLNAPSEQRFQVLHAEPTKKRDGMVVAADGTDWNPGSGAGVYARIGGAWVRMSDGTAYQPLDADLTEIAALANVSGDMLYTDATPAWARLAKGSNGTRLKLVGGFPDWTALKGSNEASAGTVSLGNNDYFHITGTTTITDIDFDEALDGRMAWVIFDEALTLTHNSTTLKLPGGANITTAAGDRALFVQDSSDNVICLAYVKADGTAVVGGLTVVMQLFAASGTYTPTSGMKYCWVRMVGGGGGGGGADGNPESGSGGAAGEYAEGVFSAATIGASQTVTIGAAGSAGVGATNGGQGGTTSLGALLTAVGGNGGQDGVVVTKGPAGGTGGTGTGFHGQGAQGENIWSTSIGGVGGNSQFAAGGQGAQSGGTGAAGAKGSGGGGGQANNNTDQDGGVGGAGYMVIVEFV